MFSWTICKTSVSLQGSDRGFYLFYIRPQNFMKIFTNLFEFLDPFIPSLKGIYLAYSLDIAHNSNAPRKDYLLKVNNRNIRKGRLIRSELTTKTPERCQWRRFAVFIVNFEHISNLYLAFVLLNLSTLMLTAYIAANSTIPIKFFRNITLYCSITCQEIVIFCGENLIPSRHLPAQS